MASCRDFIQKTVRLSITTTAGIAGKISRRISRLGRVGRVGFVAAVGVIVSAIALGPGYAAGRHQQKAAAGIQSAANDLERFRDLWLHPATAGDQLIGVTNKGDQAFLTIQPRLQSALKTYLAKAGEAYAVVVVVAPSTGRILALLATSEISQKWVPLGPWLTYPPASLFKIVSAAAAFETGGAGPDTQVPLLARTCSDTPAKWGKPSSPGPGITVRQAMARSANPVFGRLASDYVGPEKLTETASRLGFERYLFGTDQVARSRLPSFQTTGELMRAAAGLNPELRTSPFHMAMIMAAIANGGVMMKPRLVDRVISASGQQLEEFSPEPLESVVSRETARQLTVTMLDTAASGTARKAFADQRGAQLKRLGIASKTGSLLGDNPRGHYSWYAGFAPADEPQIAWAVMVVNGDRWKIKAHQVGRVILDSYFE